MLVLNDTGVTADGIARLRSIARALPSPEAVARDPTVVHGIVGISAVHSTGVMPEGEGIVDRQN